MSGLAIALERARLVYVSELGTANESAARARFKSQVDLVRRMQKELGPDKGEIEMLISSVLTLGGTKP
jgi:hypothetical protein